MNSNDFLQLIRPWVVRRLLIAQSLFPLFPSLKWVQNVFSFSPFAEVDNDADQAIQTDQTCYERKDVDSSPELRGIEVEWLQNGRDNHSWHSSTGFEEKSENSPQLGIIESSEMSERIPSQLTHRLRIAIRTADEWIQVVTE